jgi:hypothetical protein
MRTRGSFQAASALLDYACLPPRCLPKRTTLVGASERRLAEQSAAGSSVPMDRGRLRRARRKFFPTDGSGKGAAVARAPARCVHYRTDRRTAVY